MTLLGISGHARSGKDTIAAYLVEEFGFTRVALADAVRDAVYALDPLIPYWDGHHHLSTVVDKLGWEEVKTTAEGRRLLQNMGTEVGRNQFGSDFWLDIATAQIDSVSGPVVITDIRFANELSWLKNDWYSSTAIKVKREGYGPINGHSSDAGLPDNLFDLVIQNNGTIEELHWKIRSELSLERV